MLPDNAIIYHDDAIVLVNKPAGLLSVPGRGDDKLDCMSTRVQGLFPDALVVHRLDMATSGLMMMARGALMQRQLSIAFQDRAVEKHYIAVADGWVMPAAGEIDLPLSADWPNRPRKKVDIENGKPSVTRYTVLHYNSAENMSRVALTPITGRSHQLRVHMQAIGHAILGDMLYASEAVQKKAPRLLLHAQSLSFLHPVTQAPLHFTCEVPF